MFNPDTAGPQTTWTHEAACFSCSFWMDNFNGVTVHLNHRDITMVAVSRASYPAISAYKKRMGWSFPWFSSRGTDFNFDYHVSFRPDELQGGKVEYNYTSFPFSLSEAPGISVFLKDGAELYHTYSTYTRGIDMLNVAYHCPAYLTGVPLHVGRAGHHRRPLRRGRVTSRPAVQSTVLLSARRVGTGASAARRRRARPSGGAARGSER
jgi:predicted dithiol-disulfide oxidoreductase (DUF899 family)